MNGEYDPWLVALSILVAVAASYTSLGLAERITQSRGREGLLWLGGVSLAMGIGIWAMHFIGMLAFKLPIPIVYDLATTGASLVVAILVSALALHVVSAPAITGRRMLSSAVLMALGISLMHYIGMAAIAITPGIAYDPAWFGLSVAVAFLASLVALWILFHLLRGTSGSKHLTRIAAAAVMGAGISGMHFSGMAAAHFDADSICLVNAGSVDQFWLAMTTALGTLGLLAITVLGSVF